MEGVAALKAVRVLRDDHRHADRARRSRRHERRCARRRHRRRRGRRRRFRTLLRPRRRGDLVALFVGRQAVVQTKLRARHGMDRAVLEGHANHVSARPDDRRRVTLAIEPGRDDPDALPEDGVVHVRVRVPRLVVVPWPAAAAGLRLRLRRPLRRASQAAELRQPPPAARRRRPGRKEEKRHGALFVLLRTSLLRRARASVALRLWINRPLSRTWLDPEAA